MAKIRPRIPCTLLRLPSSDSCCIRITMIFVQVTSNLVTEHCKLFVITQFARIWVTAEYSPT